MAEIYDPNGGIYRDEGGGTYRDMNTGQTGTLEQLRSAFGNPTGTTPTGTTPTTPSLENRFEDVLGQTNQQAGLTDQPYQLPQGTAFQPTLQQPQADEFEQQITPAATPQVQTQTASTEGITVNAPTPQAAPQTTAQEVSGQTPTATAQQGTVSQQGQIDLSQAQGTVSQQSLAQAQTEELDQRATMTYQLGELYKSIQEGKPLPPWAAGPARAASQIMMSRGLGASSMASAATVQALMEAGLPIAAQDAEKYSRIQLQNLSNKQTTALANAATYAAMDQKNLDARMQALVANSRSFLEMDLANLNNRQATETLNFQGRIQTLLSDQAAVNAARTFNATSELQTQQFFAKLGVEVETANAQRLASMEQFNVDQVNANSRYNAALTDSANKFYTQIQKEINQSNVLWRREINTANTAITNEANRTNAQNLLGITVDAQNRIWQQYRDEARFLMEVAENDRQRAHDAAMQASRNNFAISSYNQQVRDNFWSSVGAAVIDSIFD